VVADGRVVVDTRPDQVEIDVVRGKVQHVSLMGTASGSTDDLARARAWWDRHSDMWDRGWAESWYKPFAMTRWAYDDSTIGEWYGLGFAWFLLRLALAVMIGILDAILTFFFLLGQVGYFFFGPTARNIVYGLTIISS
jgi:hypothetical protein